MDIKKCIIVRDACVAAALALSVIDTSQGLKVTRTKVNIDLRQLGLLRAF